MESKGFLTFNDHIIQRNKLCDDKRRLREFVYEILKSYVRHVPFTHLVKCVLDEFPDKGYSEANVSKVMDELIGRSMIFETYQGLFTIIRKHDEFNGSNLV